MRGEGRGQVREDDKKKKKKKRGDKKWGGEKAEKEKKQSNYQLGLEVVMKCNRVVRVSC